MLPPEIEKVLQQVQAHANYMPDWQMEVCFGEVGSDVKVESELTSSESHVYRVRCRMAENVLHV